MTQRRDAADAVFIEALAEQPEGADHIPVYIFDPQMHGRVLRVPPIDIVVGAVLLHDEDVLADRENPK
jgi:hypothetical protein